MFQHEAENKTRDEKPRAAAYAANKTGAQGEAKTPGQTKSLFSFSDKPNNTGIPAQMKEKFESASGFSFNDVRVHYNSSKPAQLQALAYTQGSQVHIAPGQERHLGHELWHVVQQKQNRVKPDNPAMNINTSTSLENEADSIGRQIVRQTAQPAAMPLQERSAGGTVKQGVLTRAMLNLAEDFKANLAKGIQTDEEIIYFLGSHYGGHVVDEMCGVIFSGGPSGVDLSNPQAWENQEYQSAKSEAIEQHESWEGHGGLYDPTNTVETLSSMGIPDEPVQMKLNTVQFARSPGALSGPKDYQTSNFGGFQGVAFRTGTKGEIDNFNAPVGTPRKFSNPVDNTSLVDLNASGKTINKTNRPQHFALADKLLGDKARKKASEITEYRKGRWTWHHLSTPCRMVLVDMQVHAKHGHNGGVYIW